MTANDQESDLVSLGDLADSERDACLEANIALRLAIPLAGRGRSAAGAADDLRP